MKVNKVLIPKDPFIQVGDLFVDNAGDYLLVIIRNGQYTVLSLKNCKVLDSYTMLNLESLYDELVQFGCKRVAKAEELQLNYPIQELDEEEEAKND